MSRPADPSYIELGVPDVDRALAFYGAVLGWPSRQGDGPQEVRTGTLDIGLHSGDEKRHFEVFFAVDDLEAAIEAVLAAGGSIARPTEDAPGFGRFVECVDDQGVAFGLRQPA